MSCEHKNFKTTARIGRITENEESDKVLYYHADVEIHCADCMKPFRFVGLPGGFNPKRPTVSVDGLELRVPIEPLDL